MKDGKVLIDAHNGSVIEIEVSNRMVVVKADDIDEGSHGSILRSVKSMGAQGAIIVGKADDVDAIDLNDRLLVVVSDTEIPSVQSKVLDGKVKEAGGIGFLAVRSPATLLSMSDEELAAVGLQRINRKREDA